MRQERHPAICIWTTARSSTGSDAVAVERGSIIEIWCLNDSSELAGMHALAGATQSALELQALVAPAWRAAHTRAARLTLPFVRSASSWLSGTVSCAGSPGVCLP